MKLATDRYGRDWSDDYDDISPLAAESTAAAVRTLTELGAPGPVLELAAGTGRLAVPLAAGGLRVVATDSSSAMLAKLRRKDPTGRVSTRLESLPDIGGTERFRLIVLAYNSFRYLLSQDDQIHCLRSVRQHLAERGVFVIEMTTFDPHRYLENPVASLSEDHLFLKFGSYDPLTQLLEQHYLVVRSGTVSLRPDVSRIVPPAELDLMARLAGLRLSDRWGGWRREPASAASRDIISVYTSDGRA